MPDWENKKNDGQYMQRQKDEYILHNFLKSLELPSLQLDTDDIKYLTWIYLLMQQRKIMFSQYIYL